MSSKPTRKSRPEPQSLTQWMDVQIHRLRDLLPAAVDNFDEDAIHDARVATRRLRAALDLVEPGIPRKQLRPLARSLRRIRRSLGALRDLDVMIGHLKERWARGRCATAADWMRQRLLSARDESRRECQEKLSVGHELSRLGSWWGLVGAISAVEVDVCSRLPGAIASQFQCVAMQAERLVVPSNHGARPAEGNNSADPHAVRIAGKLLRYTLEIGTAMGIRAPGALVKDFKSVQEELGLWHDFTVLMQKVLEVQAESGVAYHDRQVCGGLLELANTAWRQSERHITLFCEGWRRRRDSITQALSQLPPHIGEPRPLTDRPAGADGTTTPAGIAAPANPPANSATRDAN